MDKKEFSMPALNVLGGMKAQELINKGEKSLNENWENTEKHPHDRNRIIKYGVDKGEVYGKAIQPDMDEYIELARLKREIEKANPKNHDNNPFLPTFGLPFAVRMDLEARGYDFEEMTQTGDFTEIHGIIEREFPYLKWTNVILTKRQ